MSAIPTWLLAIYIIPTWLLAIYGAYTIFYADCYIEVRYLLLHALKYITTYRDTKVTFSDTSFRSNIPI